MNSPYIFKPNVEDISAHLHALFRPGFVHHFPDAHIEIVHGPSGVFTGSRWFSAFDLKTIVDFVEVRNAYGDNVYIGAAMRKGPVPEKGRANTDNFLATSCGYAEFDGVGDAERIGAIMKEQRLEPAFIVTTGTTPCLRAHLYFRIKGGVTDAVMLMARCLLSRDMTKRRGSCLSSRRPCRQSRRSRRERMQSGRWRCLRRCWPAFPLTTRSQKRARCPR